MPMIIDVIFPEQGRRLLRNVERNALLLTASDQF